MKRSACLFFILLACSFTAFAQNRAALDKLSDDFWDWRAHEQPFGLDDIPRLERPADFKPDWSAESITKLKKEQAAFEYRWKQVGTGWTSRTRADEVDYRLMGSAISRVRWEMDFLRGWAINPMFYLDQTIGSVHNLLLPPPPFTQARTRELIRRVKAFPVFLREGESNLKDIRKPFAALAL